LRLGALQPLTLASQLGPDYVRDAGWSGWTGPMWSVAQVQADAFNSILIVLAAVAGLGFVISFFNVVILVLIRASTRESEMALRAAVGASRRRLLGHLFGEGILLALLGAFVGLIIGSLGANLLRSTWPHVVEASGFLSVDPQVLLVGLGLPAAAAVLFPLFAVAGVLRRSDLSDALTAGADGTGRRGELIMHDVFSVFQLAASVAFLIGAGLLIRTGLPISQTSSLGFDPSNTVSVAIDLPEMSYESEGRRAEVFKNVLGRVGGLPGVQAESLSTPGTWLALGSIGFVEARCGACSIGGIYVPLMPGFVRYSGVSPGFFEAMGVNVLEGREFTDGDSIGAPRVVLVNRTLANSHFEGGRPLGKKIRLGDSSDALYTVVGIVDDLAGRAIGSPTRQTPAVYVSILQDPPRSVDLAVRVAGDASVVASAVLDAVNGAGPTLAVSEASTVSDYLENHIAPIRWLGIVFGVSGLLALLLGIHGAYSVMAYRVSRRRKEIGIRRAVGATRRRVALSVLVQSLGLTGIGLAIGLWIALLLVGWLEMLVPGLSPFDPLVYSLAALVLGLAAFAGGVLPARTASRVHPAIAIHTE
jgi:predicted permease